MNDPVAAAGPNDPVTLSLSKPVPAHGETVRVLLIRPPTGKDIRECGFPFTLSEDGMKPQAQTIAKLLSRLADVPMGAIDALAPGDWTAAMGVLSSFFDQTDGGAMARQALLGKS